MKIAGGTYSEICFEPSWDNIFGSGLRAVDFLLQNSYQKKIHYFTCADSDLKNHLDYYQKQYTNLEISIENIFKSPSFYYDYPLKAPIIFPRLDLYKNTNINLEVEGEDILAFGLIEANLKIKAKRVVYDPQSPVNPQSFSSTGSTAEELIIIINSTEAKLISGKDNISEIKQFFFGQERCSSLIIKMGAKGALLFDGDNEPIKIPVFKTNKVWPIGSGDIFSASFAQNYFSGFSLVESANIASKATAIYCNSKDLSMGNALKEFSFNELLIDNIPGDQVYLAGPFFTFSQRWLVNEIYYTLKNMGLNVFSPFHDVGHGKAKDVVDKDLQGLEKSKIIFAITDGLDSGTLFETGYAIAKSKKVIAFAQNEDEESLKMLEGSNCIIENDLTTAVYKTFWELATN